MTLPTTRTRPFLDRKNTIRLLKLITHIGALLPLALLVYGFFYDTLGADPIREITLKTGKTALILLVLSLAVTPLTIWFNWKAVTPLRKPLGLYAFLYVCLHLLTFVGLDYGFVWGLIGEAIFEKRYALVGFTAFVLLVPLAATSTKWAMKRLGRNWKRLHQLVYVIAVLALVHYFWLVKNAYSQPILFAVIVGMLLLSRVKPVRQQIVRWRRGAKRLVKRGQKRPLPTDPFASHLSGK